MSSAYIHLLGRHTGTITVHEKDVPVTIQCVSQQSL
jgi:hypothetical protein